MLTSPYRGKGKEDALNGLTSDYQLTLPAMLRRAEALYGQKEIVTRRPDKSFHRYTYADFVRRAKKLATALGELGLEKSDRVATLAWNNHQHLEAYFGVPCAGLVLHTINPRLSAGVVLQLDARVDDHVGTAGRDPHVLGDHLFERAARQAVRGAVAVAVGEAPDLLEVAPGEVVRV